MTAAAFVDWSAAATIGFSLAATQGRPHLPGWAPDELRTGAVLAEARAADPTRRLRTLHDREQIAELTAEEYEAEARGERLADAIAAEDGAA